MARTPKEWQQRAVDETGGASQNAIFVVAFDHSTSGGTAVASFNNFDTEPLTAPFSASELQAALELLPSIRSGGVSVEGPIGGPFSIEMKGGNAGQNVPPVSFDGSGLDPSQEVLVEVEQEGVTNDYSMAAAEYWDDFAGAGSEKLRFLYTKEALLTLRLGSSADDVDIRTGAANEVDRKGSQLSAHLERLLNRVQAEIRREERSLSAGSRRTFGGVMTARTTNGLGHHVLARDEL
jgi:hypothetical protein